MILACGMRPVDGGNLGHGSLPGCGSLTSPLDRVLSVTGLTLARSSHGRGGDVAGGPTPSGFLPTARSGNLGETCHMLAAESQAGRRKAPADLAVPGTSVTIPPPGPASHLTADFQSFL